MPNPQNKIIWTPAMIDFIKENHAALTSVQLAAALGLRRTKVREKCYELGLYKMRLEYWTPEQTAFLLNNYHMLGDVEITIYFNKHFPKKKGWTKKHIEKKRRYLKLKRTPEEIASIKLRNIRLGRYKGLRPYRQTPRGTIKIWNFDRGARSIPVIKVEGGYMWLSHYNWIQAYGSIPQGHKINRIDSSIEDFSINNLTCVTIEERGLSKSDNYIAQRIAKGNPELKEEILKHPEIIELKREQLKLQHSLKKQKRTAS